ncbi:MAG: UDP-N-acetylmuramyl-tripeptide synthetase [Candidatus Pacebacteria bacterium]|nr:UDP-N-acetylmuramyl-tripeptide synthetase [Candidatus Paceibacterota bacterium]
MINMFETFLYQVKKPYHFFKTALFKAVPAQFKNKFPQKELKIIAITGTDGKTTTTTLLYHLLKVAGYQTALISTLAACIGQNEIETGFHVTSPPPDDLYRLMSQMLKEKIEYLILEYTSQGAYQYRLFGIHPLIAGVTNISQDHFDYHLNYQNYLNAKSSVLRKSKIVVLNEDDQSFYRLKRILPSSRHQVLTYSREDELSEALYRELINRFPEEFNQMNARLAIKIAQKIGVDEEQLIAGLKKFPGVSGRMEFLNLKKLSGQKQSFQVVVDFAHTPQGLRESLTALRQKMNTEKMPGRLIAIYGCAGLRDREKRPIMGQIGSELADLVIFTAEDPRTENVWNIIRQMKESLGNNHNKVISIADRQEAINFTLQKIAKKGDLIALLGKGPEKSMCYGKVEKPWNEIKAVKKALR